MMKKYVGTEKREKLFCEIPTAFPSVSNKRKKEREIW